MEQKITKPENYIPIGNDEFGQLRIEACENRHDDIESVGIIQDGTYREVWRAERVLQSATERSEFEATFERYPVPNMVQAISERWEKERISLLKLLADTLVEARRIPLPNGGQTSERWDENRDSNS